ncbi:MAG TPA: WhiB family transcriptional regulator [Streptosporangiaceae bacterium]|nr:WhiB family transcriptional regulator [Streptosporangiaceae bacterium]
MSGTRWKDAALCAQVDPDLWFPADGSSATAATARRICAGCPVRAECLDYAVTLEPLPLDGIWAGLTHVQVRQVAAARTRPRPCFTCGATFVPASPQNRAYCSDGCRDVARREQSAASERRRRARVRDRKAAA